MEKQDVSNVQKKGLSNWDKACVATGVFIASTPFAFAEDTSIDLTTGLGAVAIVGGLMAAGSLKALPTYVGWGIKKALSMLR